MPPVSGRLHRSALASEPSRRRFLGLWPDRNEVKTNKRLRASQQKERARVVVKWPDDPLLL